jgi:hypothetical protein
MKYFTVKEASEILGLSEYKIRKMIKKDRWIVGRGPRRMYLINAFVIFEHAIKLNRVDRLPKDYDTISSFAHYLSLYVPMLRAALIYKRMKLRRELDKQNQTEGA